MLGGKGQNAIRPVALGATVNSGAYGQTIPLLYGMTKGAMYLIWMANVRQGSAKKAKKAKGAPDYVANVDWLLCHNPVATLLQAWVNQNQWLILNFQKYSQHFSFLSDATLTVPDEKLYAVLAVTVTLPYSVTFDDYGAQGSSSLSGTYEVPLWNAAYNGPDPVRPSAMRNNPFAYLWTPSLGKTIQLLYGPLGQYPIGGWDLNVYYAQIPDFNEVSSNALQSALGLNGAKPFADTPIGALNLIFEPSLGDGPEFSGTDSTSGNPLSDQKIVYPHYAGAGSSSFAMGSGQTFPEVAPEILGAFPVNPVGPFTGTIGDGSGADADFADMVEDIFYGATQAGFGNDNPQTPIQHGLNCGQRPGCVQQQNFLWEPVLVGSQGVFTYNLPNVAGDFLVVMVGAGGTNSITGISDSGGNAWTPVFSADGQIQVWYATAKACNVNGQGTTVTVTISDSLEVSNQIALLEIAGVDTLDAVVSASGTSTSVTTSGAQGTPMYLLAFADYLQAGPQGTVPPQILWQYLLEPDSVPAGQVSGYLFHAQSRIVQFPGTYQYKAPNIQQGPSSYPANHVAVLAFKCSQPPNYPPALGNIMGDIIDKPSLQIVRNQDRAAGLWGSLFLDSQTKGSDLLKQLYEAMNAWFVWSGFQGKSIARSEVSAVGHGATYIAPTAGGPIADLVESDFVASGDDPPVTVTRKAQVRVPNVLSVQHPNRASQYNDTVESQPLSGSVALYGPAKDSPKMMRMFQSPAVARMYLDIQVRLNDLVRNGYEFSPVAKWALLEPGDLITIPLSCTMPNSQGPGGSVPVPYIKIPVRILSMEQDPKFGLKATAEPFIYGCYSPVDLPATNQQGYIPQTGGDPGSVNAPIIFEPVPRLAGGNTQNQLWLVVSGGAAVGSPPVNPDYGGCFVYVSTDGGESYSPVAPLTDSGSVVGGESGTVPSNAILGNAVTGFLTEGWPAAPSPDSINDLFVDLSESHGELDSYSVANEDQYTYPYYVGGGATSPLFFQQCSNAAHSVTSVEEPFTEANVGGNTILVFAAVYGSGGNEGVNVSDSNGNEYQFLFKTRTENNFGSYGEVYVYAAVNIASGPNTVTVGLSVGSGYVLFAALEYSDFATAGSPPNGLAPFSFSVNTVDSPGGPLSVQTGAYVITMPGSIQIVFAFDSGSLDTMSVTPALGWTLRSNPQTGSSDSAQLAVWDAGAPILGAQAPLVDTTNSSSGLAAVQVGGIAFSPQPGANITGIPYELMTYAEADLTAPYQYRLRATATGSPPVANHLDRGVFGAPAPNQGVFHPGAVFGGPPPYFGGARFAYVGPPYTGIMKIALDPSWIGKTLYFKFAAFNGNLGKVQDLSDCEAYTYTPTGASGSATGNPASYTVTPTAVGSPPAAPSEALSNPGATTIDMAEVTVQFPSNAVVYNARTFTIPNPTVPTTYYVTITDPGYTGDSPGQTNLVAVCQTSDSLVGVAGNTYIGSIVALPGGGGTSVTPGGSGDVDGFVLTVDGV